jgi:hypothetical protein
MKEKCTGRMVETRVRGKNKDETKMRGKSDNGPGIVLKKQIWIEKSVHLLEKKNSEKANQE